MINTDTIQQEIKQEEQLNRMDDTNGETNPSINCQALIVKYAEKIESLMIQMEQWSNLSNVLNYIQHDRHHTVNHTLNVEEVNKYRKK